MAVFEYQSAIDAPASVVFAFHERPDALRKLIPPGQPVRVVEHTGGIRDGARVVLRMGLWPFTVTWVARHKGYVEGRQFQDVQERGPFRSWEHTHSVKPLTQTSCILLDHIEYDLGLFGFLNGFVAGQLQKTFEYRHRITAAETAGSSDHQQSQQ